MSLDETLVRKLVEKLGDGTSVKVFTEGGNCGGKAEIAITSIAFQGMPRIQRHRLVHDCLSMEIKDSLHAISISARTPEELGLK